ncbi:MAG: PspA/IM30 family protein [Cyanobacteria bacterium P01_G01_bin.54]
MTLLKRVWRLVQTNVEQWINADEDPAERLAQMVELMHSELIKLRQATAQAIATQKRTERQMLQNQSTAETWYQRAQLALGKGDEAIARDALGRRQGYLETAAFLQSQIDQQQTVSQKLKQDLQTLEQKYQQAKLKKEMYLARLHSAQATQRLQILLNEAGSDPWSVFDRVEEEILALEAEADVANAASANRIENRFAELEREAKVEAQLKQLRSQSE